ncbi:hypothetical protein B0H11DRAFT_2292451 [Mycena galericulata]|nr:hypothetical protein B0H11DRAFT_2292451 [Mycena galericulata]
MAVFMPHRHPSYIQCHNRPGSGIPYAPHSPMALTEQIPQLWVYPPSTNFSRPIYSRLEMPAYDAARDAINSETQAVYEAKSVSDFSSRSSSHSETVSSELQIIKGVYGSCSSSSNSDADGADSRSSETEPESDGSPLPALRKVDASSWRKRPQTTPLPSSPPRQLFETIARDWGQSFSGLPLSTPSSPSYPAYYVPNSRSDNPSASASASASPPAAGPPLPHPSSDCIPRPAKPVWGTSGQKQKRGTRDPLWPQRPPLRTVPRAPPKVRISASPKRPVQIARPRKSRETKPSAADRSPPLWPSAGLTPRSAGVRPRPYGRTLVHVRAGTGRGNGTDGLARPV